jgi:hypothetical protein
MGSSAATENEYDRNAEECGASAPFGAEEVFGVRASGLEPPTRVPNTPLAFDGDDGRERMKRREFIMLRSTMPAHPAMLALPAFLDSDQRRGPAHAAVNAPRAAGAQPRGGLE